jgi:hypothetical protein
MHPKITIISMSVLLTFACACNERVIGWFHWMQALLPEDWLTNSGRKLLSCMRRNIPVLRSSITLLYRILDAFS